MSSSSWNLDSNLTGNLFQPWVQEINALLFGDCKTGWICLSFDVLDKSLSRKHGFANECSDRRQMTTIKCRYLTTESHRYNSNKVKYTLCGKTNHRMPQPTQGLCDQYFRCIMGIAKRQSFQIQSSTLDNHAQHTGWPIWDVFLEHHQHQTSVSAFQK